METCVHCKERPVHVIKRGLCSRCYGRLRSKGKFLENNSANFCERVLKQKENRGEIEFIRNFFDHPNWVHHPALFRLPTETYSPDFYDANRNIFIEVSSTRQAYHQNKSKYDEFRKCYPGITLEIRIPTGELLESIPNGEMWHYQTKKTHYSSDSAIRDDDSLVDESQHHADLGLDSQVGCSVQEKQSQP